LVTSQRKPEGQEIAVTAKIDPKRELRQLYSARAAPELVDVPELSFLMIDGHGDPNRSPRYQAAVEALYAVSYALKFAIKRAGGPDYTVAPLEGLWWTEDMARFSVEDKSDWDWTMMIMQPAEATPELVEQTVREVAQKKQLSAAAEVRLQRYLEGGSAQILHLGPYADKGPTIARLHAFIQRARAREARQAPRDLPRRPAPHRSGAAQDDHPPAGQRFYVERPTTTANRNQA
jgi:hypothetical protein